MTTTPVTPPKHTFEDHLKVVLWAVAVVVAGLVIPGLGLLLALILCFTVFRGYRSAQILVLVLGVLALAFSVGQLFLPVESTGWSSPPVLVG